MAISGTAQWEVQTGGNDANGGAFNAGAAGTDYSLIATKRTGADITNISTTDAVANGTTTLTSATGNFTSALVGNIICLSGGTGSLVKTWRQINSVTNSTTIIMDASVASGTGITMNIGGALASLGMVGGTPIDAGQRVHVKAGTYTVTSASQNVSGGCFAKGGTAISVIGYQTTRLDFGTPPLIQASGISTFTLMLCGGAGSFIANINTDGAGLTSSRGFGLNTGTFYKISAVNCTNSGICTVNLGVDLHNAVVTGCSSQPAIVINSTGSRLYNCIAHANTVTGFNTAGANITLNRCISYGNTGATSDGYNSGLGSLTNCVAYANGRDGFRVGSNSISYFNCIAESNTGTGFMNSVSNFVNIQFFKCATFGNAAGFALGTGLIVFNFDPITGTGSFFTNAAGADFSLNNTAGRGAALRGVAYPTVLSAGSTNNFLDVGIAQHQDPAPGGGGETSHVF